MTNAKSHNDAIQQAQQFLRSRAKTFGTVEVGYQQIQDHPNKRAFEQAADEIDHIKISRPDPSDIANEIIAKYQRNGHEVSLPMKGAIMAAAKAGLDG